MLNALYTPSVVVFETTCIQSKYQCRQMFIVAVICWDVRCGFLAKLLLDGSWLILMDDFIGNICHKEKTLNNSKKISPQIFR